MKKLTVAWLCLIRGLARYTMTIYCSVCSVKTKGNDAQHATQGTRL